VISYRHKWIYLHPPRTGGSAIELALKPYSDDMVIEADGFAVPFLFDRERNPVKHEKLSYYFSTLGDRIYNYYIFITIRNPWDRAVSQWKFNTTVKNGFTYQPKLKFDTFVKRGRVKWTDLETGFRKWERVPRPIVPRFLRLPVPFPKIHFVEYARLQEGFNKVCEDIGVPQIELPLSGATEHDHYSTYYTDELRGIIARRFARDIRRFGYKFEDGP
jgi:hypothetical protein